MRKLKIFMLGLLGFWIATSGNAMMSKAQQEQIDQKYKETMAKKIQENQIFEKNKEDLDNFNRIVNFNSVLEQQRKAGNKEIFGKNFNSSDLDPNAYKKKFKADLFCNKDRVGGESYNPSNPNSYYSSTAKNNWERILQEIGVLKWEKDKNSVNKEYKKDNYFYDYVRYSEIDEAKVQLTGVFINNISELERMREEMFVLGEEVAEHLKSIDNPYVAQGVIPYLFTKGYDLAKHGFKKVSNFIKGEKIKNEKVDKNNVTEISDLDKYVNDVDNKIKKLEDFQKLSAGNSTEKFGSVLQSNISKDLENSITDEAKSFGMDQLSNILGQGLSLAHVDKVVGIIDQAETLYAALKPYYTKVAVLSEIEAMKNLAKEYYKKFYEVYEYFFDGKNPIQPDFPYFFMKKVDEYDFLNYGYLEKKLTISEILTEDKKKSLKEKFLPSMTYVWNNTACNDRNREISEYSKHLGKIFKSYYGQMLYKMNIARVEAFLKPRVNKVTDIEGELKRYSATLRYQKKMMDVLKDNKELLFKAHEALSPESTLQEITTKWDQLDPLLSRKALVDL